MEPLIDLRLSDGMSFSLSSAPLFCRTSGTGDDRGTTRGDELTSLIGECEDFRRNNRCIGPAQVKQGHPRRFRCRGPQDRSGRTNKPSTQSIGSGFATHSCVASSRARLYRCLIVQEIMSRIVSPVAAIHASGRWHRKSRSKPLPASPSAEEDHVEHAMSDS